MLNWLGLAIEFVFIFAVIGLAQLLWRGGIVTSTVSRKIIHIGVAHWWLLAMYFHDSALFAAVGPVVFIVLNYYSHITGLFGAMEDEAARTNLGTVYFPISLLVLVFLTYSGPVPVYVGGIGILILGYGDGLASLVGRAVSSRAVPIFGGVKSLAGTSTMLIASAAVTVLFTQAFNPTYGSDLGTLLVAAGFTAAAATLVEFVTPYGLDNLTVPIVTTLFYNGVFV